MRAGDMLALAPNIAAGFESRNPAAGKSVQVDAQYLLDLVFWQHVTNLTERLDARTLIEQAFPNPAMLVHLSPDTQSVASVWLDQLLSLTADFPNPDRFFAIQGNFSMLVDILIPYFGSMLPTPGDRGTLASGFTKVSRPAVTMRMLLEAGPSSAWPLARLAQAVHLSQSHAHHVFSQAFGVSPLEYQSMLRVREMARLLTTTSRSVQEISAAVGWRDRSHAAEVFRRYAGVTPGEFRRSTFDSGWRRSSGV